MLSRLSLLCFRFSVCYPCAGTLRTCRELAGHHNYEFTYKRGEYISGKDMANYSVDNLAVLQCFRFAPRHKGFCDDDPVPFVEYCQLHPVESSRGPTTANKKPETSKEKMKRFVQEHGKDFDWCI